MGIHFGMTQGNKNHYNALKFETSHPRLQQTSPLSDSIPTTPFRHVGSALLSGRVVMIIVVGRVQLVFVIDGWVDPTREHDGWNIRPAVAAAGHGVDGRKIRVQSRYLPITLAKQYGEWTRDVAR